MNAWSETFDAYLAANKINGQDAAENLGVSPSVVHYWRRGAIPRDEEMRKKIQRWSKGKVRADLAETPRTGTGG